MPGVIDQCGLSANVAGTWLAIIGLCNVVGSIGSGLLIQRVPMKLVLTALYTARVVGVAAFLLLPKNASTLYAFAVWMGLTYMATLPPTSGILGKYFGVQRLATLLGITMFVHQIGGFLGVWLGGVALEYSGGYDALWAADIALALIAALIHLPLREVAAGSAIAWKLDTGQEVRVRPVGAGDAGAIQAFVRGLSAISRTTRFFSAIRELDDASLTRLTTSDGKRDTVLLAFAGAEPDGNLVATANTPLAIPQPVRARSPSWSRTHGRDGAWAAG